MKIEKLVQLRDLLQEYLIETKRPSCELSDEIAQTRLFFKQTLGVVERLISLQKEE